MSVIPKKVSHNDTKGDMRIVLEGPLAQGKRIKFHVDVSMWAIFPAKTICHGKQTQPI